MDDTQFINSTVTLAAELARQQSHLSDAEFNVLLDKTVEKFAALNAGRLSEEYLVEVSNRFVTAAWEARSAMKAERTSVH